MGKGVGARILSCSMNFSSKLVQALNLQAGKPGSLGSRVATFGVRSFGTRAGVGHPVCLIKPLPPESLECTQKPEARFTLRASQNKQGSSHLNKDAGILQ